MQLSFYILEYANSLEMLSCRVWIKYKRDETGRTTQEVHTKLPAGSVVPGFKIIVVHNIPLAFFLMRI